LGAKEIAAAFERTARVLKARPSAADHADQPALARWDGDLRCSLDDGHGRTLFADLPPLLGGQDTAPSPGWLLRAGLAACLNTCIVATAAREAIELTALEVEALSHSDVRGLLGVETDGGAIDPGPRDLELVVRISAHGASPAALEALVTRAQALAPVTAALALARPVAVRVEAAG
jgi:uncharacterized OsmC-like protein